MKTDQMTQGSLISATEVAAHLNVHRATIYKLAQQGRIPYLYVGSAMRFSLVDVMDALSGNTPGPSATEAMEATTNV